MVRQTSPIRKWFEFYLIIYSFCHTSYLIQFMLSWGNGGRFLSKGKVEIVFSRETKDESVEKESRTWGAGLCPESWIISQCFPERTFLEALIYNLGFRTQVRRSCHRFLKNFDDFFHSGSSEIKFSPLWCIFSILYWILNSNWSPWIYFHIALDSGTIFQGAMCSMV